MRLLVTRPDGARTAAGLRKLGHEVMLAPMLRIEHVVPELTGPWAAVALTSANAARAIAGHPRVAELRALPLLVVGRQSAAAAREAGFARVTSAEGALGDLRRLIATHVTGRVLYLAGEDRAGELGAPGLDVEVAVVYRAVPVGALPEDAIAALEAGQIDAVLHYSARSAEAFLAAAGAARTLNKALRVAHYCLSAKVAVPLQAAGAQVRIAAHPDEDALIALTSAESHVAATAEGQYGVGTQGVGRKPDGER